MFLSFSSCQYFNSGGEDKTGQKIARVGGEYLYDTDLAVLINEDLSAEDSVDLVNYHIKDWIKRRLLLQKATYYLPDDLATIEQQVQDYRETLTIFLYEQELLNQNLDTLVSDEEITDYYHQHKASFELRENIVKAMYIVLDAQSTNLAHIQALFKEQDRIVSEELQEYCFQHSNNFNLIADWYEWNQFVREIPITRESATTFLPKHSFYQTADSSQIYLVKVVDYAFKGNLSPLDYKKHDIAKVIVNKRKLAYIKSIKNAIYQDALNNSEFEIF